MKHVGFHETCPQKNECCTSPLNVSTKMHFKTAQRLHLTAVVILLVLVAWTGAKDVDEDVIGFLWTFTSGWIKYDVVTLVWEKITKWMRYPTTLLARFSSTQTCP